MKSLFKNIIVAIITFEAKVLIKRKQPKIIAVTGSVGKTSTKDAIYAAIKNSVHARKSAKTYNSDIGVPLSVLGLTNAWNNPFLWLKNIVDGFFIAFFAKDYPDVLVLETGIDRPGDMANLTKWIKPDVAVVTRLPDVPVHIEYFSSPEEVIKEKMLLVEALKPDGVFVYNQDDEIVRREVEMVRQQSIGFSRYSESHFTVSGDKVIYTNNVPAGISFKISHLSEEASATIRGSVGIQQAYAVAAAAAVANQFSIDLTEVCTSLENYDPPPGRMRVLPGIKGTTIIDDSYNSSPVACERALQTLSELRSSGRKIAVLGDMLELGKYSVRAHETVGEQVAKTADVLFAVGVRSKTTAQTALEYGLSEKQIFQYDDEKRARKELQNFIQPGDLILIKGSQSIRTERIVKEIMAEPDRAEELLVRQSRVWQSKV